MTKAAERIWAKQTSGWGGLERGIYQNREFDGGTEYTRTDISNALIAAAYDAAAEWHLNTAHHDQGGIDYSDMVGIPISNRGELSASVETHTWSAEQIRALTPDDARAAYDAAIRAAKIEGMREAAEAVRDSRPIKGSQLIEVTDTDASKIITALIEETEKGGK